MLLLMMMQGPYFENHWSSLSNQSTFLVFWIYTRQKVKTSKRHFFSSNSFRTPPLILNSRLQTLSLWVCFAVVYFCPPSSFCINWLKPNSLENLLCIYICLFKSFFSPLLVSWPEIQNSVSKYILLLGPPSSYFWFWVQHFDILKLVSPKPRLSTWL